VSERVPHPVPIPPTGRPHARERRAARGLTQAQLGAACGLHRTFVGSVERGERNVALLNLRRLDKVLRIRLAELLDGPP
jgi:transcriptional regulator with XRE-family HTH domain